MIGEAIAGAVVAKAAVLTERQLLALLAHEALYVVNAAQCGFATKTKLAASIAEMQRFADLLPADPVPVQVQVQPAAQSSDPSTAPAPQASSESSAAAIEFGQERLDHGGKRSGAGRSPGGRSNRRSDRITETGKVLDLGLADADGDELLGALSAFAGAAHADGAGSVHRQHP